jgi:uncharacterized RDD family membrane protein YckC
VPVPDDPPVSKPDVPSPEEARRLNLRVSAADEEEARAKAHGAIAPFNLRFLAGLIDTAVCMVIGGVFYTLPVLGPFLGLVAAGGYALTRDCLPFLNGQSLGKKIIGLMVLDASGRPLTGNWQSGLIRNAIFLLFCAGQLIETLVLLTREDKAQRGCRLGDEWAGTKVVIHRPEPANEDPSPVAS